MIEHRGVAGHAIKRQNTADGPAIFPRIEIGIDARRLWLALPFLGGQFVKILSEDIGVDIRILACVKRPFRTAQMGNEIAIYLLRRRQIFQVAELFVGLRV